MAIDEKGGYSKEEEYFYKLNKQLIEQKRAARNKDKDEKKGDDSAKFACYMKCPKCGADMEEIALSGIMVDKCPACKGIYFDHGELDILLEAKQPAGFLGALKGIFKR